MIGFFLMLILCSVQVAVILRAGFSIGRMLVALASGLLGILVMAIPGTLLAIGGGVVGATGMGGNALLLAGGVLCVAGLFPSGFVGMALVERWLRNMPFSWKGSAFYLAGLGAASAVAFGCLILAQNDPFFEIPFFALMVSGVPLGGVAGYAVYRAHFTYQQND